MKKKFVIFLSIMMLLTANSTVMAKITNNSDLTEAIKLYKRGNYTECYAKLENSIKRDPSNPLAYYYKGMTAAQIGKKAEAIENYQKALNLAPKRSNLVKYAEKGKRCLETPDNCNEAKYEDPVDEFIRNKQSGSFSEEARGMFEKLKIEQMMRDMNRNDKINPQQFREYRDFSSMNNAGDLPTNDEIANAVRVLQKAGLMNFGNDVYSNLSLMSDSGNSMLNHMYSGNMSPQLIQTMLTNNMSLGF